MEYLVGLAFSLAIAAVATFIGFDRDRSFYPTILIVIALVYVLFAAMGASAQALLTESLVAGTFFVVAVIGFKTNLWLVLAALVGHGVFDLVHHLFIDNPAVPHWWPGFCMAVDLILAVYLGGLLVRRPNFHSYALKWRSC